MFDRLERDKDGTLDKHELARRLSARELAAADPDHDGTLDAKELKSGPGRALLRLLK
jgi:Ca2+-binding EF-hand superfamily protein